MFSDTNVVAALVGAISALIGTALFTLLYEAHKERTERGRVASALLAEILAQGDFVVTCGTLFNASEDIVAQDTLMQVIPPRPSVFPALAAKLPLLEAQTASAMIAFYGSLDWLRALADQLPTRWAVAHYRDGKSASDADIVLEQASRASGRVKHAIRAASETDCWRSNCSTRQQLTVACPTTKMKSNDC